MDAALVFEHFTSWMFYKHEFTACFSIKNNICSVTELLCKCKYSEILMKKNFKLHDQTMLSDVRRMNPLNREWSKKAKLCMIWTLSEQKVSVLWTILNTNRTRVHFSQQEMVWMSLGFPAWLRLCWETLALWYKLCLIIYNHSCHKHTVMD